MRTATAEVAQGKVRYVHVRVSLPAPGCKLRKDGEYDRTLRFGATIALFPREAGGWFYAWAVCSSQDQFSKKRGRQIARGRLFAPHRKRLETKRGWTSQAEFVDAVADAIDALYEQLSVDPTNPRWDERRVLQVALLGEVGRMREARERKEARSAAV